VAEHHPTPDVVAADPPEHPIEPLDAGCDCDNEEGDDAV